MLAVADHQLDRFAAAVGTRHGTNRLEALTSGDRSAEAQSQLAGLINELSQPAGLVRALRLLSAHSAEYGLLAVLRGEVVARLSANALARDHVRLQAWLSDTALRPTFALDVVQSPNETLHLWDEARHYGSLSGAVWTRTGQGVAPTARMLCGTAVTAASVKLGWKHADRGAWALAGVERCQRCDAAHDNRSELLDDAGEHPGQLLPAWMEDIYAGAGGVVGRALLPGALTAATSHAQTTDAAEAIHVHARERLPEFLADLAFELADDTANRDAWLRRLLGPELYADTSARAKSDGVSRVLWPLLRADSTELFANLVVEADYPAGRARRVRELVATALETRITEALS